MQPLQVCVIEHGAALHCGRFMKSNAHLVQTQFTAVRCYLYAVRHVVRTAITA